MVQRILDPDAESAKMTLGEHFDELRRRLLRAVIGTGVGVVLAYCFGRYFFSLLFWPLAVATGGSPPQLYYTSPAEAFTTYLTVCAVVGAIVASPYAIYQIWSFVAAGLYEHERRTVRRYLLPSIFLFLLGVAFFFVVVAPMAMRFFLTFADGNFLPPPPWGMDFMNRFMAGPAPATQPAAPASGIVHPWLTLGSYTSFISLMSLVFALAFQTPLVVIFLVRLGLVSLEQIRKARRYVFMSIIVISAIITPSADAASMIAMAVPMQLLFELGLLVARTKQGRSRRQPQISQMNAD